MADPEIQTATAPETPIAPPASEVSSPVPGQQRLFDRVFRFGIRAFFKIAYRLDVRGVENAAVLNDPAKRTVIVANHISYLDALAVIASLPKVPTIAMNTDVYEKFCRHWLFGWAMKRAKILPVDFNEPMAVKSMIATVKSGEPLLIFPEGRLTDTGRLTVIEPAAAVIAAKADAEVLPLALGGFENSNLALNLGKLFKQSRFPKLRVTITPPKRVAEPLDAELQKQVEEAKAEGREPETVNNLRREHLRNQLTRIMQDAAAAGYDTKRTLVDALHDAAQSFGPKREIIADARIPGVKGERWSYRDLLTRAYVTGEALRAHTGPGEVVGVLLPNVAGHAATLYGLMAERRVPAELNPTMSRAGFLSTLKTAEVKTIVTSRVVVEKLKLEDTLAAAQADLGVKIIYAEDLRKTVTFGMKMRGWLAARSRLFGPEFPGKPETDRALILFTSGSEGAPKGVVFSHSNLLANCAQVGAVTDINPTDTSLSAMPLFHSFGLTGGLFMPLYAGIKTVLFPDPKRYAAVPRVAYQEKATILFGTNTFLNGWGRKALPGHLNRLRLIVGGAAKIQDDTRAIYRSKFGREILEGYGATEAAPVIAMNTGEDNKPGTVGHLLPGIETKLEPFNGTDGYRLYVRGPNVMMGYLRAENPGVIEPPVEGWHDTGDVIKFTANQSVRIVDRAKDFAKIGGEMVSLVAAEKLVADFWNNGKFGVIAVPCADKGQKLVLFAENPKIAVADLLAFAAKQGETLLAVPRQIVPVAHVPELGSGKVDRMALRKLWADMAAGGTCALAAAPLTPAAATTPSASVAEVPHSDGAIWISRKDLEKQWTSRKTSPGLAA